MFKIYLIVLCKTIIPSKSVCIILIIFRFWATPKNVYLFEFLLTVKNVFKNCGSKNESNNHYLFS